MCLFSHGLHSSCSMLSHGIHRTFLLYILPRIALFFMFSHGIHGIHRTFLLYILPRIAQIFTEPSCRIFSHGIHGIYRTFLLYILPRIAQIFTDATFKGVHLSQVHQPVLLLHFLLCWCTSCSVGVLLALLVHFLLCWCTSCSVGALETSAPPERTYLCQSVNSVGEYLGRVISVGVLPVNLLLAMLAQIGIALREVVVAEPSATVGRQR